MANAPVFSPRALEQGSLALRAYLSIRDRILKGELPLGAALSRRQLAAELSMSVVPVSEALQRLQNEGLIETKPRIGTRVYQPTVQDIRARYVVREALESQSARLFSEKASPQERKELWRMAEHMDALFNRRAASEDAPEFQYAVQAYHFQFHMRIAECTGCEPLLRLIEQTHVLAFNWVWDLAAKRPPLPQDFHRVLAEALVGADPLASDTAMRSHIRYGLDGILRAIDPMPEVS